MRRTMQKKKKKLLLLTCSRGSSSSFFFLRAMGLLCFFFFFFFSMLLMSVTGAAAASSSSDAQLLLQFKAGIVELGASQVLADSWVAENVDSAGCPQGWYGVTFSNPAATWLLCLSRASRSLERSDSTH
jgi:hypothetical protein